MVVQEEDEAPVEAVITKKLKYVIVKNHVREFVPGEKKTYDVSDGEVPESNKAPKKQLKKRKKSTEPLPTNSEKVHIDASDLDELKTFYNKCKAVLQKIESKYGHLLDLDHDKCKKAVKHNYVSEDSGSDDCTCSLNKKIIFDENGHQIEKECELENHICPKRKKMKYTDTQPHKPAIQVEYDNINVNLPENLKELENMLKDPNIDNSFRKMVIDKVYVIRQEYLNEMRYERDSLVKILKENPDELLDFKGTNISTLPGYPIKPWEKKV